MVADFNKKRKEEFFTDKLLFKAVGVVFLLIIIFFGIADYKIYQKKKELNAQIVAYKKQIEDIKKSNQTLKNEIANSDNTDYLEKLAYEQLGEQRPGEKQVIFVAPAEKPKTISAPQNFWDTKTWMGWLSGVWSWIKAKF